MSLTRTPPLRTWRCSPSALPTTSPLSTSHLPRNTPRQKHQQQINTNTHSRTLHTTAPRYAARSPLARRYQNAQPRSPFSPDGLLTVPAQGDFKSRLQLLGKTSRKLERELRFNGAIDDSISSKTFNHIARAILENAYTQPPSAAAVRGIHADPNVIFEIGNVVVRGDRVLHEWLLASCTLAGARQPTLIAARRYLNGVQKSGDPLRSSSSSSSSSSSTISPKGGLDSAMTPSILSRIEAMANDPENPDPAAMLLHAKALGLRGQYEEALALVWEVMRSIYPEKKKTETNDDITGVGIETPWKMYSWLRRGMEKSKDKNKNKRIGREVAGMDTIMDREEEDVVRHAALEYQDPESLMRYASLMMERGDLKTYEQCMASAAMAGNADACRKLANFYYLTYMGRYPRLGEKKKTKEKEIVTPPSATAATASVSPEKGKEGTASFFATLVSYFKPRPLPQYRALALEWYHLGQMHGCPKAGVVMGILCREDGADASVLEPLLEEIGVGAGESRELSMLVKQLRERWTDESYKPEIPGSLLDV